MNKIYEQAFKQQQQREECKDEEKDEGNSSSWGSLPRLSSDAKKDKNK